MDRIVFAIGSVILVSLASVIGILIFLKNSFFKKYTIYFVTFSASIMLATAFLHLLPEMIEAGGCAHELGLSILVGMLLMFILEKFLHWHHCHREPSEEHPHVFAKMNLIGDGLHNFIDGILIGVSYITDIHLGVAVTVAILLHEIPQEMADYGVLIHGGFSKKNALIANLTCASTAIVGTVFALVLGKTQTLSELLLPYGVGMFIYIAGSDLIPEINKHNHEIKQNLIQISVFLLGIFVVLLLGQHSH